VTKELWILGAAAAALVAGGLYYFLERAALLNGSISAAAGRALIDRYCVDCHDDAERTANLTLERVDLAAVGSEAETWEKVIRKLRAGMMPPPDFERPAEEDYAALRDWLEAEIDRAAPLNPGTKVLHRLNRTEYANVIRDLLALEIDPALFLPPDDSSRGFDNIAGSLTISPTLIETYATAATKIARMAVGFWKTPTESLYIKKTDSSQAYQLEDLPFGTRGGMTATHVFPADGEYTFTVRNLGVGIYIPGEQLELSIDGERVHTWLYTNMGLSAGMDSEADGELTVTIPVTAGSRLVGVTFVATNFRPSLDVAQHFARKSLENGSVNELSNYPVIGALNIQGPFNASRPMESPSRERVFTCRPATTLDDAGRDARGRATQDAVAEEPCAREIVSTLLRRAFRRPVTPGDLEIFMGFYENGRAGGTFDDGVELALRRMLASPQFLIRAEQEPEGLAPGEIYRISDLELASRLSFFLWSSIPDDELLTVAAENRLKDPDVLAQQVRRMLADPRSESLVTNFGRQWLYLRNLATTAPDQTVFPDWDDELRAGFARETELLLEHIIREDRSVVDILDADYTFLNERLARHYGVPNIYGSHFRRVSLGPELDYRRGILGQGSFLSTTWVQNNRTSPVKRGVWVLENILGTPPPEPPPTGVPGLEETEADGPGRKLTLREQMTLHRSSEACASCHKIMDPIGFALENFSADGQWRTLDGGAGGTPLDVAGELWDGTPVVGPVELREAVMRYSPQFVRMATEKLMTYALGRGVEYSDMPVIRSIVRDAERNDNRFSSLVLGIVNSAPFQMRTKSEALAAASVAAATGEP
jgi:mono/diheme cytochrome c family protein